MKKLFFACAALALLAGPVVAQEKAAADKPAKKEASCNKGADAGCCKTAQAGKSKSCCAAMPSKAAALKATAAAKKPAKPAPKG